HHPKSTTLSTLLLAFKILQYLDLPSLASLNSHQVFASIQHALMRYYPEGLGCPCPFLILLFLFGITLLFSRFIHFLWEAFLKTTLQDYTFRNHFCSSLLKTSLQ
ncbi:mCG7621, partial [Mus musculus]